MPTAYPSKVNSEWLKKYMTELHFGGVQEVELEHMDTEWDDPALVGEFKLTRVPLSSLTNVVPHGTDEMLAGDYAEMDTPLPPIVLDSNYKILDGNHRAMAASLRGDTDIQAYVPVNSKIAHFISVPLGMMGVPHTKIAISVPELVSQTNAFSVKRRPGCSPSLIDSKPKQLFLKYNVKCRESYSDPAGHTVTIQFDVDKVEETQNANDLDVMLNCSCPAFLYWGAQWNLHEKDGLLGEARPELVAPTKQLDLRKKFLICKHCKAVLERILPSVQHNIQNIIREKKVQKNKELKKQPSEKSEKLNKEQDAMKKRQELKKLRQIKNKDIQQKLIDALREKEEGKSKDEVVERDERATTPLIVDTPKTEDVTKEEPDGDEDLTGLLENEENKLNQENHQKIKDEPHLHKGLPYETDEQKQEHGHEVPSDDELIDTIKKTRERAEGLTKDMREFIDSGNLKKVIELKKKQRKQTSLEDSLLSILASSEGVE